jgi:glucokinase
MSTQEVSVGIDIGGTNIKFGIVDGEGRILRQRKVATDPARGSETIVTEIVHQIWRLLEEAGLNADDLTSIGLGVPGTADPVRGTVVYAPNLFWRDVPIASVIQAVFRVPISLAQDTRAAAWAEYVAGSGRGLRGVAAVTLGTGVGCGMVIDGKIFHGALNTAGEFGHQIVEIEGKPCNCGRHGCLEAHAGGLAIVREAENQIPNIHELLQKKQIDVADVYHLAESGNAKARKLTDRVVKYIGVGLVNLINLNSIEMICLSGGISNAPATLLLDPLLEFVRCRAYEMAAKQVRICRSTLGEDAPLIGAALLHRESAQAALLRENLTAVTPAG